MLKAHNHFTLLLCKNWYYVVILAIILYKNVDSRCRDGAEARLCVLSPCIHYSSFVPSCCNLVKKSFISCSVFFHPSIKLISPTSAPASISTLHSSFSFAFAACMRGVNFISFQSADTFTSAPASTKGLTISVSLQP